MSAQADPDGHFPTVAFPNPEEDGALDLALATAKEVDAHVILANDPDADRLAVAYKDGDDYRMLNGNEIGVLLGVDALFATKGKVEKPLLVNSLVSSTWLAISLAKKVSRTETLTGFKWIANTAMQRLSEKGENFIFGYEEAIGYTVGDLVRDKDGVASAAFTNSHKCARVYNKRAVTPFKSSSVSQSNMGWLKHCSGRNVLRVKVDKRVSNKFSPICATVSNFRR